MRYDACMMFRAILVGTLLLSCWAQAPDRRTDPRIPIKVVVVTMFERGADTGDTPGEFQYWVEREKLDRVLPFPTGYHDLRMNGSGILGMVTGIGTAKAAASVMALGLDPRFDLRRAYWLVAGIAGIDPADGSLGSAAWAEWVVDGDIGHEIDAREIPANWKTGYVPLRRSIPYEQPRDVPDEGEVYHLNPALVDWAFRAYQERPTPGQRHHAPAPPAVRRRQRPPPALRPQGRYAFIQHLLARQAAQPVG